VDVYVRTGDGRTMPAAIYKAAESGGRTVQLASGSYPVSASIHLRDNVRLGKTVLAMTLTNLRAQGIRRGMGYY